MISLIERSIAWNRADGLELVNAALMDAPGEVSLNFDLSHTGAGYISRGGGIPVRAITLDDDLEQSGITRVDLLKIDVEGNEGVVLTGLRRSLEAKRIGAVYFEYCPEHIQRAESKFTPIDLLTECGYDVFAWGHFAAELGGRSTHRLNALNTSESGSISLSQLRQAPETRITDLRALQRWPRRTEPGS